MYDWCHMTFYCLPQMHLYWWCGLDLKVSLFLYIFKQMHEHVLIPILTLCAVNQPSCQDCSVEFHKSSKKSLIWTSPRSPISPTALSKKQIKTDPEPNLNCLFFNVSLFTCAVVLSFVMKLKAVTQSLCVMKELFRDVRALWNCSLDAFASNGWINKMERAEWE